jgi:hypothetical protein
MPPTGTTTIIMHVQENCTLLAFELSFTKPQPHRHQMLTFRCDLVCHKHNGYSLRPNFAPIRGFDEISPSTRFPSEMLLTGDNGFTVIVYQSRLMINKRHRHIWKRRHVQPNSLRYFIWSRNSILMCSGNISGRVARYSSSLT